MYFLVVLLLRLGIASREIFEKQKCSLYLISSVQTLNKLALSFDPEDICERLGVTATRISKRMNRILVADTS